MRGTRQPCSFGDGRTNTKEHEICFCCSCFSCSPGSREPSENLLEMPSLYSNTQMLIPALEFLLGDHFPIQDIPILFFPQKKCALSDELKAFHLDNIQALPSWTQLMLADTQFKHSLVVYREDQIPRYALGQHTVCWIQLGH